VQTPRHPRKHHGQLLALEPPQARESRDVGAPGKIGEEGGEPGHRGINRLKQWRGLATRYEKRAVNYRAMVVIASIAIWLGS